MKHRTHSRDKRNDATSGVSVALTGGGTAGHIFPGLAVADELTSRGYSCFWIGRRSRLERRWVERAGVAFHPIPAGKLRRYFSLRNALDAFAVAAAVFHAIFLLRRARPAVLFSKGGFVGFPPALAAWLLRIPVVAHESDATPALATRLTARLASAVLLGFGSAAASLPARSWRFGDARSRPLPLVVTGNPLRRSALGGDREAGRLRFTQTADASSPRPVLLVMGGSLGARQINEMVGEVLPSLLREWAIVHQTGAEAVDGADAAADTLPNSAARHYRRFAFIDDGLADLFAAATVAVSRAGANTLAELAAHGVASVLVPLPVAQSRGEQLANAEHYRRAGAARVLAGDAATAAALLATLRDLQDNPAIIERMRSAAASLATPTAAADVAALVARHADLAVRGGRGGRGR